MKRLRTCASLRDALFASLLLLGCSPVPSAPAGAAPKQAPPEAGPPPESVPPPAPAFIRATIDQREVELRGCYEAAAAVNPDLQGTVTMDVSVDARGRVSAIEAIDGDSFGSDPAVACMVRGLRRWKFDMPEGAAGLDFRHAFEFRW